jgi:hypothetical protein
MYRHLQASIIQPPTEADFANHSIEGLPLLSNISDDGLASLYQHVISDYDAWYLDVITYTMRLLDTSDIGAATATNNDKHIHNTDAPHGEWAELSHCHIDKLLQNDTRSVFTEWATPLLQYTMNRLWQEKARTVIAQVDAIPQPATGQLNHTSAFLVAWQSIAREITMQLIEMYFATMSFQPTNNTDIANNAWCDWTRYRPTVPATTETHAVGEALKQSMAQQQLSVQSKTSAAIPTSSVAPLRLVFNVIVFKDIEHVRKLVESLLAPTHWIIVHVDNSAPADFVEAVKTICRPLPQVYMLQFGNIVYKTDSVSMIQWRIM